MKQSKSNAEQIIGILREQEGGMTVARPVPPLNTGEANILGRHQNPPTTKLLSITYFSCKRPA